VTTNKIVGDDISQSNSHMASALCRPPNSALSSATAASLQVELGTSIRVRDLTSFALITHPRQAQ
jgi:hypothetical protein